jgi:uncharacterized protein YndB with AHSA1/START domain
MKKLESKIDIAATPKKVWDTMTGPETYREWVNAAWPGSYYEGNWKQGENIRFLSPGQGGTLATIVECKPHELIRAKHVAVINPDGTEDRDSETAKGWIGTTETYRFVDHNGKTELRAEMSTNPEWEKMFADSWPKAFDKLKEISER